MPAGSAGSAGEAAPPGSVLQVAACAVMTGARSYVAIWQWAQDLSASERAEFGLQAKVPSESTIHRVLQRVDADLVDAVLAAWAAARRARAPRALRRGYVRSRCDGKTARGARRTDGSRMHLLAAIEHDTGAVLAQAEVEV